MKQTFLDKIHTKCFVMHNKNITKEINMKQNKKSLSVIFGALNGALCGVTFGAVGTITTMKPEILIYSTLVGIVAGLLITLPNALVSSEKRNIKIRLG